MCAGAVESSIESPGYTVVHAESNFEIRLYRPAAWITTPVEDISFTKATQIGFHKYFSHSLTSSGFVLNLQCNGTLGEFVRCSLSAIHKVEVLFSRNFGFEVGHRHSGVAMS